MTEKKLQVIDHIHLNAADFDTAAAFYHALFEALGWKNDVRSGREWPVDFQIALSGFAHHPVRTSGVDTSSTTVRSSLNHTAA